MRKFVWESEVTEKTVSELLPRAELDLTSVTQSVDAIIREVKDSGLKALYSHAEKFDGVRPTAFRVPESELSRARSSISPELRIAMEESARRVEAVSRSQMPVGQSYELAADSRVDLRFVPFEAVGVYAPGGKALYPSSVIMNVVPAQVAGVARLILCSPAQKENAGLPHPTVLAAAKLLGVSEVYAIGGATAVAALAYGIEEIGLAPVDLVTGPGNIFVATAKQLLRSKIAIDSEAGPTEILIIADQSANPEWIAADLVSQAEHDENAAAILLTDSEELLDAVSIEVQKQASQTTNSQRVQTALSGKQSALVLVHSLEKAIEIANVYATEHLEIQTRDNGLLLEQIRNAGAIFVGEYSPVSLGDYLAGSNHVLPTSGNARRSSGLSVFTFLRQQQVVSYGEAGLREVTKMLEDFSNAEGLPAHGQAARIRFNS